jgi:hypothetical protein
MGWKEAQRRYKKGETLADQSIEDRVARRVLRGLGLPVKELPRIERMWFGDADFDEALWPRTLAVWKRVHQVYHRFTSVEVVKLDHRRGYKDIMDRLDEVQADDSVRPVFMTMETTSGVAYIAIPETELFMSLTPPYKALDEINGMHLIMQDIEHYVRSTTGIIDLEVDNG